jgi:hypothetical protein
MHCSDPNACNSISAAAFFPDNRYALSVGTQGIVCYWELTTGKRLRSLICSGRHIAIHPEGNFAIVWNQECKLIRINHLFEMK